MARRICGSLFEMNELIFRCLLREMVNLVIAEINQQNDEQYRDKANYVCNISARLLVEWIE